MAEVLLTVGKADANVKDGNETLLTLAALRGSKDMVRLLLSIGKAEFDGNDSDGLQLLNKVVSKGFLETADVLLAVGMAGNNTTYGGESMLIRAISTVAYQDTVEALLVTGKADANEADIQGKTPLMRAVQMRHIEQNLRVERRRQTGPYRQS